MMPKTDSTLLNTSRTEGKSEDVAVDDSTNTQRDAKQAHKPKITYPKKKSTKATASNSTAKKPLLNEPATNGDIVKLTIADILDSEYRGISLYAIAMLVLIVAALWTGTKVVEQIQTYHQTYSELLKLKRDFRQLQIERQRMLIEQQTFSATPQVTHRAVTELNMFYPNFSDRMIIHANSLVAPPATPIPVQSHTPAPVSQPDPESQH